MPKRTAIFKRRCEAVRSSASEVARRPWAPRTFLEFAIKTSYVLDPWKTFCWPWVFSGVLESSWTVV